MMCNDQTRWVWLLVSCLSLVNDIRATDEHEMKEEAKARREDTTSMDEVSGAIPVRDDDVQRSDTMGLVASELPYHL